MFTQSSTHTRATPRRAIHRRDKEKGGTYKSLWIGLLLALHLLAIGLPAGPVLAKSLAAGSPAMPCQQYDDGGPSASTAAVAAPAGDQQVNIPKSEVDKAIFYAKWQSFPNAMIIENVVFDQFLLNEDKMPADFTNADLSQFRDDYRAAVAKYLELLPEDDMAETIVHTMLNMALDRPELAPAVPFVWRQLMSYVADDHLEADQKVGQSAQRYDLGYQLINRAPEIIQTVYECAHKFPEVAAAFDYLHKDELNASILDDSMTILEKNLDLKVPAEIEGRIAEDGSVTISLDELKALSQGEFDKIHESISDMQDTLYEVDQKQDVIIDYLQDLDLRTKHQALMAKKAAEQQAKLDAAKSGITVLSTLIGKLDPKLGKQIGVVGQSTLQVGMAVNSWLKAISGLKGVEKLTSLSTVAMTGNVIGAVMNIISLFGDEQPAPEQIILEEIGKLRQQVDHLRTEMHSRFDRIDAELNAIYTTMNDRFDQIDIQLGQISGNIHEVQQSLLSLDLKLSRIERNNFEFLNTLGRRPLLEAINGGLGYEQRTGELMPYQPEFVEFENTLHSWATIHAFDPVNAGPTVRNYSDDQVYAELSAYPLDSNLNYLNGWLVAHGLPAISDKQLPSPRDWLFAGRAYTELGLEWPAHMKRIDPQRQQEIEEIGVDLETAMQKLSTQLTQTGPVGNSLLFSTVITYYDDKVAALDSGLQGMENNFVNEVYVSRLNRAEPFNLYGGVAQPLAYVSPEISNFSCGNAPDYGAYALNSNLRALIPNFDTYNLAEYLRMGNFAICVDDQWLDAREVCYYPPQDLPVCETWAYHSSMLTVYFTTANYNNVKLVSQTVNFGDELVPSYDPESWSRREWIIGYNYKRFFDALTSVDVPTPEVEAGRAQLLNAVNGQIQERLAGYQQELYGRILNEMSQGALKPAVTELAGGTALLNGFVSLGLPRALANDEFMHAMLFGSQRIIDDQQIQNTYALSMTTPITAVNLLSNPRQVIATTAAKRTAALDGMIREYLTDIREGKHIESADYIGNTRRSLELTMRVAQSFEPETAIAGLQASSNGPTLLGQATTFSAAVNQGSNVLYTWDFGDGQAGSGANPSHTYAAEGVYVIKVTASNNANQASAELQVEVYALSTGQAIQKLHLPLITR